MSKYIKIANNNVKVNRLSLEKLGLSTKRDNPETIGQFGSGIKYAPISALRMGIEFIFTGEDDKGQYTLKYDKKNEDGIDCIIYNYGDYAKDSSFTVDAGRLSWENHFQIYREVFSNAKDAGNYSVSLVNGIDKVRQKDQFAIYITASPEMMKVYNDHKKYFCENREVLFSKNENNYSSKFSILKPYDNNNVRIYCKSVLVHTIENKNHLFDYELNDAHLNEDRELKSLYSAEYDIAYTLKHLNNKKLIRSILQKTIQDKNSYHEFSETSNLSSGTFYYGDISESWKTVFYDLFGEKAILVSPEIAAIKGSLYQVKIRGYEPIIANSKALFLLLKNSGVEDVVSILGEEMSWDIENDISKYSSLVKAIKIASKFEPGLNSIKNPIGVFKSPSNGDEVVLGLTVNNKNPDKERIVIEKNHAEKGSIPELIGTIIHEYDHLTTKLPDECREFRDLADRRIGLMYSEFYTEDLINLKEDGVFFTLDSVVDLGGLEYELEYSDLFKSFVMRIGKKYFVINAAPNVYDMKYHKTKGVAQWLFETNQEGVFFIDFKQSIKCDNASVKQIQLNKQVGENNE